MQLASVDLKRLSKAKEGQQLEDGSGDVVFAIFLEPRDRPPGSEPPTFFDKLVTFAVTNLQPSPVMTHVELVVPCVVGADQPVNFATYIGSKSGWQRDSTNNERYYLVNNANCWRAVPVFGTNVARLCREVCDDSIGVHYSLVRYATASWAFRGLSSLVPDKRHSPAHCATLTARILRSVVGTSLLRHSSAWYGPASLYAELCSALGTRKIAPGTTLLSAEQAEVVDVLLRHSDDEVKQLGDARCLEAIRALTLKTASAEAFGDSAMKCLTQKQLATALLRWSVLRP
jgi:hypothetical protein|tara:strand:- start:8214 stop:9074 length:861 start_codon:yes stop_codon:yes gene_type:complete